MFSWNRKKRSVLLGCAVVLLIIATTALCYAQATIVTEQDYYAPQEPIFVKFSGLSGGNSDWITVVPANTPEKIYKEFYYTKGMTHGRLQFAGLAPGSYEVRGFFNWNGNLYEKIVRYQFTVKAQAWSGPAPGSGGGTSQAAKLDQLEYAFKTFVLWVPGTSYVIDNYDRQTSTLHTSTGTLPKSTISINKDGTYIWNSAWDEKIINGRWTTGKDGTLNLLQGQEGKTWTVEKSRGKNEDIFLMDGSIWYSGKTVTLKNEK